MTHEIIRPAVPGSASGPGLPVIYEIAVRWRAWARRRSVYRRTVRELENCSNRELADLSIARVDIPRIAAEAAGLAGKDAR